MILYHIISIFEKEKNRRIEECEVSKSAAYDRIIMEEKQGRIVLSACIAICVISIGCNPVKELEKRLERAENAIEVAMRYIEDSEIERAKRKLEYAIRECPIDRCKVVALTAMGTALEKERK